MKFFNNTSTPTSGTLRAALISVTLCAFTFLLSSCSDQRAETSVTNPQPQAAGIKHCRSLI